MDNKEQCRKLANRIYELDERCTRLPVLDSERHLPEKSACAG